ncbi:unnamed protein product [Auanema sp. JU1783]|nr:unnamed protein product [Auanema sp. JU1783]
MGSKSSKGRVTDHVAFSTNPNPLPNIVITKPTPLNSPESPKPFAPPPSPTANYYYPEQPPHRAPPPTPLHISSMDLASAETAILAGTPPLDRPPDRPPPPPPVEDDEPPAHPSPFPKLTETAVPVPTPRTGLPTIKRNIIYAKDKIAQFEALNTTDRKKENGYTTPTDQTSKYYSVKQSNGEIPEQNSRFKPFNSAKTPPPPPISASTPAAVKKLDNYPVYNPVTDFTFKSGQTFQRTTHPVESNRINIGFFGRKNSGKSGIINALRGMEKGELQAAGKTSSTTMEPFKFAQAEFLTVVLWEIPYPSFTNNVVDVYDRNMSFDKMYETHKLHLFNHIFVMIPDGSPSNDDISFTRIVHSRRTPITFIFAKTDEDLDAEGREQNRQIDDKLKKEYETRARSVFVRNVIQRGQVLRDIDMIFISSPVIQNILCGTTDYLHYKMDEMDLIREVKLRPSCHFSLEQKRRREKEDLSSSSSHYEETDIYIARRPDNIYKSSSFAPSSSPIGLVKAPEKSTTLVDAGFEILYGTDDRVFGNMEPQTTVRRAGKTAFNYGFIGGSGVGKSAIINALRGMTSRHPLAAGKTRSKAGNCERFEFEDELLKYNVTLWELHYPKKINSYFEFIDRNNFSTFTAIFVLINGIPSDQDLSFSKIAHRRNASVVFLSSKSDKKLSARSRSDEIPVCDLLKQRFVDKGIARFDRALAVSAPELSGRVHTFFVSAPVFYALRKGDPRGLQFSLHERAVFDFLKQKRIIADLLDTPANFKEGIYANVNTDTAGVITK